MPSWKKVVTFGSDAQLSALNVTTYVSASEFRGPLTGTSSFATSASYAVTASYAENAPIATTASYALTASSADDFNIRGNLTGSSANFSGNITASNLLVNNTITAKTLVVQVITSSTEFITGSTRFGSQLTDTHQFTGSVTITGSLSLNGDPIVVSSSFYPFSQSVQVRLTDLETTASVLTTASASFAIVSSSYASASGSLSTRVTTLENASASFSQDSGSNSIRFTNLETTASVLTTASASFAVVSASYSSASGSLSTRTTNLESTASVLTTASASFAVVSSSYASASGSLSTRVTTLENASASFAQDSGSNSTRFTNLESTSSVLVQASASFNTRILNNSSSIATLSSSFLAASASFDTRINDISGSYITTASYLVDSASFSTRITNNSSSIAVLSGSFLVASASFDTRINNLTESVFTHIVTNNGASNYIIDGVAKPKLSFVPGATYRFNTSGVVGSHPFKFSTSPNGPTEYTTGVTSGSGYIQIEVNYDTPTTLYYYCTIHSGMGNEANTLRIDTLVTTSSFNSFTGSYYTDSSSFNTRILNNSSSIAVLSGSFLVASASFDNRINSLTESIFTHIVTNNGASNYIIDGVTKPKLSFVPGATYRFNTSGVVGSHPFRFSTSPNGPTEYTTGVTIGANYTQIEVNYDTPTTLYYYCTIHSGMGNEINALRVDTLVTTASFNSFTGSYYTDSASFNTRITNNSASIATISGSFLVVSASYASLSSSFTTGSFTGSFSGSFLGTGSYSLEALSASYAISASHAPSSVTASYALFALSASHAVNSDTASYAVTASHALTASSADNFVVRGNLTGSNALFSGTITAQTLYVQTITSSVDFVTGSTRFGTQLTDTHQFTGSVTITGSLSVNNNPVITQNQTSSMSVLSSSYASTASYAINATSASYSLTSSYSEFSTSSSYAIQATSASHATNSNTASYVENAKTASFVQNAISASYVLNAISSSFAATASFALNVPTQSISASYALTASYVENAQTASFVQNAVSSSFAATASFFSGSISNAISASYALSASQAQNSVSSSYALTASFALNAGGTGISAIYIADEGNIQGTASFFDFVGAGVTATISAGTASINIAGGGGSTAIQGAYSVFTQSIAATTWSISHAVNSRIPIVEVYDNSFNVIIPTKINNPGPFNTDIYFDVAQNGYAIVSTGGDFEVTGSNAILNQSSASTTWSFQHSLQTQYPVFTIFDSNNDVIIPQRINAVDTSSAVIYFSSPRTGKAVASVAGPVLFADSSSFAVSASYAISSSHSERSISSSYALSSSHAATSTTTISSSYSATSSFSQNAFDILVYVKNSSGAQIDKGKVVRIVGAVGDNPLIATASYEDDNNSANTLGITNENIANNGFGYVMTEGTLFGVDTSAFSAGQLIFLGATGSITGSSPIAPLHNVRLGEVLRVQQNNGSIYVRVDNGYELGELHDVRDTTTTGSYGDLLVKSGSIWINSKQLTGSYGLTGSLSATQITGSDALFSGTITAQTLYVQTITSSTEFITGSTRFGSQLTDTHQFTGSVTITGSLSVNNSPVILTNQTSSMIVLSASYSDTASYVQNAQSASYVLNAVSASYSTQALSSSYALTASFALNGGGGGISSISIADEGTLIGTASYFDFIGNNITASVSNGTASITVVGATGTSAFTQSTAAATWSFVHNLNTFTPLIQAYTSTYNQLIPNEIVGIDPNVAEIRFDYSQSGYAVASNGGPLTVSGSTARLNQNASSVTWSFAHNLNSQYVNFEVYDSNNFVIIPANIKAVDSNNAELYFATPSTGVAIAMFSGINGAPNAVSASFATTASFAATASYLNPVTSGYVVLTQISSSLNYADDTAAAAGGVPLGGLYRNGNFILIRIV